MKKYKVISESYEPKTVLDLLRYMVRPYRARFAWFLFLSFMGVLFWTASPFVASEVINQLGEDPTLDAAIWWLVALYGAFRVADEVFWRVSELVMRSFKPQMVERVRATLYRNTITKQHLFFVNSSSGRIAHWINQATFTINQMIDVTIWTVWGRVVGMVLSTIFLMFVHWSLALLFIGWLVLLFWFTTVRGRKFGELVEVQSDETSIASGLVVDTISNNLSVRVFNSRRREQQNLDKQQDKIIFAWRKSWIYHAVTNAVKGQSASVASVVAMVLALVLFSNGTIGLGGLVLFLVYFGDASGSLWQLAWSLDSYYRDAGTVRNVILGLQGESERDANTQVMKDLPTKVDLQIDDITFAYPEQKQEKVLRSVSITAKAGEKVGVVGHSGAGKSTLVSLMLDFYEPTDGQILVNGDAVSSKPPEYIRSLSSFVPQDTNLFNRTVRENVMYARPDATEEELFAALRQARALDFVEKLSEGVDTLIGERGVKLSGGQRQRIAIARAILRDAPLLILDEATSALDSVSEQAIQKALHELMKGRTALVIAHRLSTLKHLDRIYVMEEGVIVESGTHAELVKLDGIYADLWRRQKDGFIVD